MSKSNKLSYNIDVTVNFVIESDNERCENVEGQLGWDNNFPL